MKTMNRQSLNFLNGEVGQNRKPKEFGLGLKSSFSTALQMRKYK